MRHLAYLQAVPRPPRGSKRAEAFDPGAALSRRDQMKKDGVPVLMPVNPAPHIIDRLIEVGLTEAAGMGAGPVSWGAINEWQRATRVILPPWEAKLLRRLSSDYLSMSRAAEEETCPAPWRGVPTEAAIKAELRALDAVLG